MGNIMRQKISIAVVTALIVLGIIAVVAKTNTQVKLHQLDLKTKDQEIQIIENQLKANQIELEKSQNDKKKLKELEQKNKELQKAVEDAQARKAEEQRIAAEEAQNAAMAAPEAPQTTSCEQLGSRLAGLGVPASDMTAALYIAQRESGCNSGAVNASSGACGEFQSLPCGKWGSPGTDQYLQNAINYAVSRYGGWQEAYSYWQSNHWW